MEYKDIIKGINKHEEAIDLHTKIIQNIENDARIINEQVNTIVHKQEFYTLFLDDYSKYVTDNDWSVAINKALGEPYDNSSKYYNKKIKVEFNPNVNYIIKSKILYNPSLVEIKGNQSQIQTQGMNDSTFNIAIELNTGTQFATNYTGLKSLSSLWINGEGITNTIGLYFNNCGDLLTEKIRVQKFGKNIYINDNSYILTFNHCNLSGALEYGVYMPSNGSNYGERITFIDCNIGNSNKSIYNANPNGEFFFTNCSFDYNTGGLIDNINGKTYFTDCHFEQSLGITSFILCNAGVIKITNGWLLGMGTTSKLDYLVKGDSGRVTFNNVFLHNLRTTSGFLSNENVILNMNNTDCYNIHESSMFTNSKNNVAINDNVLSLKDLVCILNSEGTITDKHTSSNLSISCDENGILVKKQYGQYSIANFGIFFPIKKNFSINSNKFKIAKLNNAGNGGYITIEKGICYLDTTNQVPKILKSKTIGNTYNVNFSANESKDWTEVISNGMVSDSEPWANYFYITFNMHVFDGNNNNAYINIKDLWFETL